jgi:small-conductance mechanosensitive channel
MTVVQKTLGISLAVLLLITVLAWWQTNPKTAAGAPGQTTRPATSTPDLVDQSSYATAQRLSSLATGTQELRLAQSALRITDHELDLAFAMALRQLEAHPPALSGPASQIQARLEKTQQQFDADQKRVKQLSATAAQAAGNQQDSVQDELDLAKSQLELDQYEIEEANQDLEDAGGNLRRRIEALVAEHEAAERTNTPAASGASLAVVEPRGLVHEFQFWLALRQKRLVLEGAQSAAGTNAAALSSDRQSLANTLEATKNSVAELAHHTKRAKDAPEATVAVGPLRHNHADAQTLIAQTRQIASDQNVLSLADQRILAQRNLAGVYQQWGALAAAEGRAIAHELLTGAAIVIVMLMVLIFLDRWLQRLFGHSTGDRRQVETLRSVTAVALQIIAVLIVIFMLIGVPDQFGTVLGIVGAGLTVALKDFIVAFIGWLMLMGKNGIRLGDWVEINGVSGEVIELGMFNTVLLETGNWSDAGHPTGRRVTFTNSFAIEGHYFNFSTSGQWLWDELQLIVPAGQDPHPIVEAIKKLVQDATADSARQAEQEWQRAVPTQRGQQFSGSPGINVKPVVGGVELSVRYITRANERFLLRAKLYQAAVDLLAAKLPIAPT